MQGNKNIGRVKLILNMKSENISQQLKSLVILPPGNEKYHYISIKKKSQRKGPKKCHPTFQHSWKWKSKYVTKIKPK